VPPTIIGWPASVEAVSDAGGLDWPDDDGPCSRFTARVTMTNASMTPAAMISQATGIAILRVTRTSVL
jgi:hypothetical protein